MNDILWRVIYVSPQSPLLIDRTGVSRVATTDPKTHCVYLSNTLTGEFLNTVLLHELGHCVMFSYGLLNDIHKLVAPEFWIEAEEWVCNFIADYGLKIFSIAYDTLEDDAWACIPYELEKIIA